MTIFSGIIYMDSKPIPTSFKDELINIMENDINESISYNYTFDNLIIIGFDNGAFHTPALINDDYGLTLITGDPVIRSIQTNTRFNDTQIIHKHFLSGSNNALEKARGTFSGIHYNKITKKIYIFTDKLGIRPVYYYFNNNKLIFSSIFKYFKKLSFLECNFDTDGLAEEIAFRYPLSDRTVYKNIKRLKSASILSLINNNCFLTSYWKWENNYSTDITDIKNTELIKNTFTSFKESIHLRLGDERNPIAFLSGGLDSRCITSLLKDYTGKLYTFNFSTINSQDSVLARLYSKNLGSIHYEIKQEELAFPNFSSLIADAVSKNLINRSSDTPKYPRLVWSGDGGSVGTGFVYLDEKMIDLLIKDQAKNAIEYFLRFNKISLPFRYFSKKFKNQTKDILRKNIYKEISSIPSIDEKKLYFFLMFNDQRRHLDVHFESIGQHRTELLLPFFDSNFLSFIFSLPIKECLYHKFYMQWLNYFPGYTQDTPWQTYPGHIKCPIKLPDNLSYQWDQNESNSIQLKKNDINSALKKLFIDKKVGNYTNKPLIFIALVMYRFNIKNYSYLLRLIKIISRYT